MKGQPLGYIRISSFVQKPDRQLANIQVTRFFGISRETHYQYLKRLSHALAKWGRVL